MTNALAAVIACLIADTAVNTLVSGRVFGAELPEAEACNMPRAAVVVTMSGGGGIAGQGRAPLRSQRFDFHCYGATPLAALQLEGTVYDAMKACTRDTVGTVLLHSALESGGPISLKDPDTNWPFVSQSWLVLASTTAAA